MWVHALPEVRDLLDYLLKRDEHIVAVVITHGVIKVVYKPWLNDKYFREFTFYKEGFVDILDYGDLVPRLEKISQAQFMQIKQAAVIFKNKLK